MNIKRRLILLTVLLLIALLTMLSLRTVSRTKVRDLPQIQKDKILNIVTEYNSVGYYVSGDSVAGLQYELCKYIGERSGLTVQVFIENNLDLSIKGLANNRYDIIARNISITNENRQIFAFTVPITQSKQVLVQRKPSSDNFTPFIRNQIDLSEKTVYVTQNAPAILRLKNLAEEIAEPIYIQEIENCTSEQLIHWVAIKDIDYAVVDMELARINASLFPELDFKTEISFTQLQAWALRPTSVVLLDSLNTWISDFKETTRLANYRSPRAKR